VSEPVPVQIPCPCPGTPHGDGDTVYLRAKLDLHAGIAVQHLIINANQATERLGAAELTGVLAEGYLLYGVESWTLVDEDGRTVPVTQATIRSRLLSDFAVAAPVAEMADDLYMAPVLLPLVKRASASLPTTPTNGSTSAPPAGTPKPRKPSKRSSTITSLTDDTVPTSASHAGASSSSRS
jgi:hypothetical protein